MLTKTWSPKVANDLLRNLPAEEQARVIEYGAMLWLADLRRQLFHAQSAVKELSAKNHTTLADLAREGLPDDAGYEMHEDYILWHHYAERIPQLEKSILALEEGLKPNVVIGDAG